MHKVVVTGGSGFVGKRLQLVKPEWTYLSSKDVNLLDFKETKDYFQSINPDSVVHLAGKVGGIIDNLENPADFFSQNARINMNVVDACHEANVPRMLASLSTCAFPDVAQKYPFDESTIFDGKPAHTNLSYGYSKRLMYVHINALRQQYGRNYSTFSPSNLYGPGDNFDLTSSHFVAAAIRKIAEAKDKVVFWGTGKPLRQQLFVDDLCKIIPVLLTYHCCSKPLIVAPEENLSIEEMVDIILQVSKKDLEVVFNGKLDGQLRKDGSNNSLVSLVENFKFTPFNKGVLSTYNWYLENEKSIYNRN